MTPKDVLTLLQIVDLSSKSPAYATITSAAHNALAQVQLHLPLTPKEEDEDEKGPPSKKGSK